MNTREHFFDLLDHFDTAMLVTHDEESQALRSRPMHIAKIEDNGDVWFLSGRDATKNREIRQDQDVLLTFQQEKSRYISLAGKAEVVQDRAKLDELWNDAYRVWFPDGKNDPNISLLRVKAVDAEYWDNAGMNKLSYAVKSAKALVNHDTPDTDESKHFGHVELGTPAGIR